MIRTGQRALLCDLPHPESGIVGGVAWVTTRKAWGLNFGRRLCVPHVLNTLYSERNVLAVSCKR